KRDEILRTPVAVLRVVRKSLDDDFLGCLRQFGPQKLRFDFQPGTNHVKRAQRCKSEGAATSDHLVGNHPEGIDVTRGCWSPLNLFGSHIGDSASDFG